MATKFAGIRLTQLLNANMGRLIVRGPNWSRGTIKAYRLDDDDKPVKTYYADFEIYSNEDGEEARAAVFPALPTGNYKVSKYGFSVTAHDVTIYPADVREITLT